MDPRIKALVDRKAELLSSMKAMIGDATKSLTEDEGKAYDEMEAELKAIPDKVKEVEASIAKDAARRTALAAAERTPLVASRQSQTDLSRVNIDANTQITTREAFLDDPKRGFKTPTEFLMTVKDAAENGRTDDARLKSLVITGRSMTAGSDEQSTTSNPYGGFLIPTGYSPNVLSVTAPMDPLANLVNRVPMNAPTLPFNARVDKNHATSVSGGFVVYRRAETQAVSSSRQSYEQVTLNAQSLMGLAYSSEELLNRSPISFVTLIEAGMRTEFPAKLMKERISGTGVGQFEGVLNSPALISVAAEAGQAASTITFQNVIKMSARCWGYGQAVWLANYNTRVQLRSLVQNIGTGGVQVPLFTTDGGVERLDGRPIYFTEFCPALGTVGDLLLCNWSEYLEGTLQGLQSAESMHVRFETHERTFKFWMENDGRGWWRSALTPFAGDTLSPFVALATR